MTEDDQPQHPWKAFDYPLAEKTHGGGLHDAGVDAGLHLDHVEEVEHDGYTDPREIDCSEHEGSAIGFSRVQSIQVCQFEPKEGVIGHIQYKGHNDKDADAYGLQ